MSPSEGGGRGLLADAVPRATAPRCGPAAPPPPPRTALRRAPQPGTEDARPGEEWKEFTQSTAGQ